MRGSSENTWWPISGVHPMPAETRKDEQAGKNWGQHRQDGAGQKRLPAGKRWLRQSKQTSPSRAATVLWEEGWLLSTKSSGINLILYEWRTLICKALIRAQVDYYGESTRLFTHLASSQGPVGTDAEYDRCYFWGLLIILSNTYS